MACGCHCCCLHPNCGRYSCCCWRPFSSLWVTVAGLPANAGIPGVTSVSEVPFELAVAGGPVVIGFPVVGGVLAVASIPADPGVPFLLLALPTGLYTETDYYIIELKDYFKR